MSLVNARSRLSLLDHTGKGAEKHNLAVEQKVKGVIQVAGMNTLVRPDPTQDDKREWFRPVSSSACLLWLVLINPIRSHNYTCRPTIPSWMIRKLPEDSKPRYNPMVSTHFHVHVIPSTDCLRTNRNDRKLRNTSTSYAYHYGFCGTSHSLDRQLSKGQTLCVHVMFAMHCLS